ncbi:MAG: hypothetical protein WC000_00660 [Dokdonella sp.]
MSKPAPVSAGRNPAAGKPPRSRTKTFTPEQAAEQMRALLEAKNERVRQGPSWPAANAHAGHVDGAGATRHDAHDLASLPVDPQSNLGVAGMHGRGNQGKRGQS